MPRGRVDAAGEAALQSLRDIDAGLIALNLRYSRLGAAGAEELARALQANTVLT